MTNKGFKVLVPALAALALLGPVAAQAQTRNKLVLWLKADQGLAPDGSSWLDGSGKGHNATAVAGEAPTVEQNAFKGLPVAAFSGGQAMAISGAVLSSQQFTILAVVADVGLNNPGFFREVISNWDYSTEVNSIFLGTVSSTVSASNPRPLDRIRFTDQIGGATDPLRPQDGEGRLATPAVPFILTAVSGATDATIYVNGKRQFHLGAALTTRDLTQSWWLGRQGTFDGEHWDGFIAEVMVFDKKLSAHELTVNTAYLMNKWQ